MEFSANIVTRSHRDGSGNSGFRTQTQQSSRCHDASCAHNIQLALEHGRRLAAGVKCPAYLDRGLFFEPTTLDLADNTNSEGQEENFESAVGITVHRDVDHAIKMANDSKLNAATFHQLDLCDPPSLIVTVLMERSAVRLVHLFRCTDLPHTPPPLDVVKVNYMRTRLNPWRMIPLLSEGKATTIASSRAGRVLKALPQAQIA